MKSLLAAIRFLTIIPVPGRAGTDEASLAGSPPFFPFVGLLLGAVAAAVALGLQLVAPPLVTAGLLVVLLAAFSGGLHLDGLSDTADGFLSHRPRERILEIMKDSHVGAMGVLAIVCVLMLKFAALAEIAGRGRSPLLEPALLMPLAGRCAMLLPMALLDYVRPQGLGSVFRPERVRTAAALAVACLIALPFAAAMRVPAAGLWRAAALRTAAVCGATVGAALLVTAWSRRKIGGATGDVYGATCELGELAAAIAIACL